MVYLDILRFSFLRYLTYPHEIVATILKTFIELYFWVFFWGLFAASKPEVTVQSLASYFLVASGVNKIVMAQWGEFSGYIGRSVKMGLMNNYLMRPYNTLLYLHALSYGKEGISIIIAFVTIALGLALQTSFNLISLGLFILFLILAIIISFAINLMIGTIYFHATGANGILNAINHLIGVLSGLIIPLYIFPHPFNFIVQLLPFSHMVFGPVNGLRQTTITADILMQLMFAFFWAIVLNIAAFLFWKSSTKKYEAIGI